MAIISLPFLVGALTLSWLAIRFRNLGHRPKGYPPGPPTLPIIGNIHQIPKTKIHVQFEKWAKEYGPVFSLVLGANVVIVLSSDMAVNDLLEKRSAIYSSRPSFYLSQQIGSGGMRWTLMEYGERWRKLRKVGHSALNINTSQNYVPYQDLESVQMLAGFLDKPADFIAHIERTTMSLITQVIFGFRTHTLDHEYTKQVFKNVHLIGKLAHSAAIVDNFPFLKNLPNVMLPARQLAQDHFKNEKEFLVNVWKRAKEAVKAGGGNPCLADELYKAQQIEKWDDSIAAYACITIQEAAADTSTVSILNFIKAMILHPEVQRRGQEEVDQAFGDSLPSLDDAINLPYVQACVKETLRWLPATPLSLPHCVTQDDEYLGYKIPKGATVIANVWGLHRDADRYPDPAVFDPTRFSDSKGLASESYDGTKRDHYGFGFGRRVCPGQHIAERTVLFSVSRLLWAFNFNKAVDDFGNEILPPRDTFADGVVAVPPPFQANITCRSAERAKAIRQAWAECEQLLDKDFQWKTSRK
ncbi:cytochrome P450 [Hypoxylon argillaceum]|nr:cytochrome P450 [Hypoxylon argillaceum]